MKDMCIICRLPKDQHERWSETLYCPPRVIRFQPCTHLHRVGNGAISSDGKVSGQDTCMDCGETFSYGSSQSDARAEEP